MVQGLTIVTKDADFHQRSFLFGLHPRSSGSLRQCLNLGD